MPSFEVTTTLDPKMDTFARTWPDTLCLREPLRDLGYAPLVDLREVVEKVLHYVFSNFYSNFWLILGKL